MKAYGDVIINLIDKKHMINFSWVVSLLLLLFVYSFIVMSQLTEIKNLKDQQYLLSEIAMGMGADEINSSEKIYSEEAMERILTNHEEVAKKEIHYYRLACLLLTVLASISLIFSMSANHKIFNLKVELEKLKLKNL